MTIDPAIVIAFLTALLGLLGLVFRAFMSGDLHPRTTVPRADYEALRAINADYPEAIAVVAEAVKKLAASIEHVADNGTDKAH